MAQTKKRKEKEKFKIKFKKIKRNEERRRQAVAQMNGGYGLESHRRHLGGSFGSQISASFCFGCQVGPSLIFGYIVC